MKKVLISLTATLIMTPRLATNADAQRGRGGPGHLSRRRRRFCRRAALWRWRAVSWPVPGFVGGAGLCRRSRIPTRRLCRRPRLGGAAAAIGARRRFVGAGSAGAGLVGCRLLRRLLRRLWRLRRLRLRRRLPAQWQRGAARRGDRSGGWSMSASPRSASTATVTVDGPYPVGLYGGIW